MSPERQAADAVVIGAGIVGVCTALHLQRTGRRVALIERDVPGAGASGHNGGVFNVGECVPTGTPGIVRSVPHMLRDPMSPLVIRYRDVPRLSPWLVRFALASRPQRVETIAKSLKSLTDRAMDGYEPLVRDTPAEKQIRTGGIVFAYCTEDAFRRDEFARDLRARNGQRFNVLDDVGVGQLDPALRGRFQRAVHMPEPRFTPDPQVFTETLANEFVAGGGTIVHADATGFERSFGRVDAVTTTIGPVAADQVVIAAGAWSRRLTRRLGLDVPLDVERGYGVVLPDPGISVAMPIIVTDYHVAFRSTPAGLQVSGVDELASVTAPPRFAVTERLIKGARTVFPEVRVESPIRWMHQRPSMPDSLPVIGRLPRSSNVVLAFGHGHKGLGLGGITGQLVSEIVDGQPPSVDLEPFRPTRFRLGRARSSQ
ncbi:MAG TPA: FAD-binding oxidoreductase [Jatrophihabitans sp.]|nr:FAD-binding oxidoreductase [Jatrophihabitans sp.]